MMSEITCLVSPPPPLFFFFFFFLLHVVIFVHFSGEVGKGALGFFIPLVQPTKLTSF